MLKGTLSIVRDFVDILKFPIETFQQSPQFRGLAAASTTAARTTGTARTATGRISPIITSAEPA